MSADTFLQIWMRDDVTDHGAGISASETTAREQVEKCLRDAEREGISRKAMSRAVVAEYGSEEGWHQAIVQILERDLAARVRQELDDQDV